MIAYSPEAEPARAFLLRRYNDIDVYVEDTSCLNMYVTLINRILAPKGKRITHVFPLGSRSNVLSRCRSDQAPSVRKRIYLIDGDLDLLLKVPAPRLKHLYRLKVYCTENLLMSEAAAVTIGTESATNIGWHDMAIRLSLKSLIEQSVHKLLPLFVVYAIVHQLGIAEQTVAYPVQRFLKDHNDPTTLSGHLVRQRMNSLIRIIETTITSQQYRRKRDLVARKLAKRTGDPGALLSGKTYLLPIMQLRLRQVAGFGESSEKLKARLAVHCELNIDPGLPRAILREIK